MIEIQGLSKEYGDFKALKEIDLSIPSGKIVGLLGLNGAGKTTLMRVLTGYLPFQAGTVNVLGMDIEEYPKEVKSVVGYLPEHCPLYSDMSILEFLNFCGDIRGLRGEKLNKSVQQALEDTSLHKRKHQLISALSKGYRQRVGLAQAILHSPRILVLDEPTVGLDPGQIQEIRSLISGLRNENSTIILSTHILSEVSQVCDYIVVIANGQIRVSGTETEVMDKFSENKIHCEFQGNPEMVRSVMLEVPNIVSVSIKGKKTSRGMYSMELEHVSSATITGEPLKKLLESGIEIYSWTPRTITLEEVFMKIAN